jgi:uncharacterized protein YbjT (DUF2867 family)
LILVSGATGRVGGNLVRVLSSAGAQVRVIVRDLAAATRLIAPGVEIVRGDFEDEATLDAAMEGVDKAFLLPPGTMRQVKQEANFIDAAKRAKLRHVVKLSLIKADPKSPGPIPQWHGMAEKRLEASGVKFTHLRPNFYMQNMFWFSRPIREIDTFCLPMGDAKIAPVDVRDIASTAAEVLLGTGHEGRTYLLTGPETMDCWELAEQFSLATGRRITYKPIAPEEFKSLVLKHWNLIEPYADAIVSIWRGMAGGGYDQLSGDVEHVTHRKPGSFADFLRDHAEIFAPTSSTGNHARQKRRKTA